MATKSSSKNESKKSDKKPDNDTRKAKESIRTETLNKTAERIEKSRSTWRIGQLFWGGLLIIVGTLLLLDNLNVVETNLAALWQLWPLLLVAAGLSVLSVRNTLWKTLSTLFVFVMLGFVLLVGLGVLDTNTNSSIQNDSTIVLLNENTSKAETSIKMGAGTLTISSAKQEEVVRANITSSFAELVETQRQEGDSQLISLETKGSGTWWFGAQKNELDVVLSQNIPQSILLDVGALSMNADLSEIELSSLNVKTGASSVLLRLGERSASLPVTIDAGASSVKLAAPKESGIRVEIDGGLSSRNLEGLVDRGNGIFETENYDTADKKITITVKSGLSSFELTRY
jgi:hypothetical protein